MDDLAAMDLALEEARAALTHGDVPIGAVVVVDGQVVARRHNERERTGDPTAHAELLALRDAATAIARIADAGVLAGDPDAGPPSWRVDRATMYVTLEPCAMCAGALVNARLGRLVYGAANVEAGAAGSLYNLLADPRLNHEVPTTPGVAAAACAALLSDFFAERRAGAGATPGTAAGPGTPAV